MTEVDITSAYLSLCERWRNLNSDERNILLERFGVRYSYNSGHLENPEITFHDTSEIFDKNGISNYTGDVRTLFEIANLKEAWYWLMDYYPRPKPLSIEMLLLMHEILTKGTYDDNRWNKGERPGSFKVGDYRVGNDVGFAPEDVFEAVEDLVNELNDALAGDVSKKSAGMVLTIAAYAHAKLVSIHPFVDGNGRVARLLMNYILLSCGNAPCSIDANDRLAYYGALDAFDQEGNLKPFKDFCKVSTIKFWGQILA